MFTIKHSFTLKLKFNLMMLGLGRDEKTNGKTPEFILKTYALNLSVFTIS